VTLLVVDRTSLNLKLRTVIRAITLGASTLGCEIGRPPPPLTDEDVPRCPYVILWPQDGEFEGYNTLGSPEGCASLMYRVTAVGENAEQASRALDKVRTAFLGRTSSGYVTDLNTSDLNVGSRWSEGPDGLDSDSRLYNETERFGFLATLA
jgi:hypothetical protein